MIYPSSYKMAHRQVETTSIHSSTYHTGWIRVSPDSPWEIVAHSTHERSGSEDTEGGILPATYLDLSCQIHMPGQMKPWPKSFRWNKDIHFHQNLRLPPGNTTAEKGMLVLFEAMASEGLTVALSPQPAFQRGATFEITFGAVGNTKTTIVRKFHKEVSEASFPCRVCHEGSWSPFWIAVWQGKVYAGVGKQPGHKCLAFLNDKEAAAADTPGNVMDKQRTESGEPTAEKEFQNAANSSVYVGIGNAAQQRRPLKVRSLQVTLVPSFVAQTLESTNDSSTMDVLMEQQEEIDDEALKEYQEQCRKAKSRAEKFGIEYKEPDMASVVPWSQARKLRANPQKGFITGIDITDPDELAKQEARKARFGESNKKREIDEDETKESQGTPVAANPPADASTSDAGEDSVPLLQAWDNEELVRFQRSDPPLALWAIPREDETENNDTDDEFAMETDKPTLTPEKIHMFSIDWAAFKQIRTDDIMAYFTIYGPSYVEWLGDLSCNVLFEDKFSAIRAMQAMARELPTPPPAELNKDDDEYHPPDFGAMGWKLGKRVVRKIKNDRFGRRGTTARILMRPATTLDILLERPNSWPEPPPGFSTKRILGPGSDYNINAVADDDDDNDGRSRKRRRRNFDRDTSRETKGNSNNSSKTSVRRRKGRGGNSGGQVRSTEDVLNQGLSSSR